MNINALAKIAADDKSGKDSGAKSVSLLPAGLGGLAALATHTIMSPSKKEKENEDIWSKLLRWLSVAGAGVGAYYLGKNLGAGTGAGSSYDPDIYEAEKRVSSKKNLADSAGIAEWAGHAGAGAAAGKYGWDAVKAYVQAAGSSGIKSGLGSAWKAFKPSIPLAALGEALAWPAHFFKNNQRKIYLKRLAELEDLKRSKGR
jgi:hypothetical protein